MSLIGYDCMFSLSVQQSVKDVLDDLKGDGLVDFDKIGTSNCMFCSMVAGSPTLTFACVNRLLELSLCSGCHCQ